VWWPRSAREGCGVVVWRVEFQFPLPKTNMAPENEALEKEIPIDDSIILRVLVFQVYRLVWEGTGNSVQLYSAIDDFW